LPLSLVEQEGGWEVNPGSGGLVTALAPVLRNRGGLWIGWPGTTDDVDVGDVWDSASKDFGYELHPVPLTREELCGFYYGFSNEIMWPLFHDLQGRCNFVPEYYYTYLDVNRKYAKVIADTSRESDFIWVHDYHLMYVAHALRLMGVERRTGFFLHIPFPPADIFLKLPWRDQILRSLLEYDLIGFQTMRDRRNFTQCIQLLCRDCWSRGRGAVVTVHTGKRDVGVGSFPISIDFNEFAAHAESQEVAERAWYIHEKLPDRHIILGADRLDYTKGIPERLAAFRNALTRYPELQQMVTLIQVVVPSRENVPEYQELRSRIEQMVGEINGQFTSSGWVPIHYLYRNLSREELLAYYRTAEVALVTPLKDGMNLVAKEYCACNLELNGVLILSEFAGAAAQLHQGALLVNPYDVEGVAEAIHRAIHMDQDERRSRMKQMRDKVRKQNIFWWVDSFLDASLHKHLEDFPEVEDYVPSIRI
jgi:trehalose 6-phosphate synthase